jgi:hypothetical protein
VTIRLRADRTLSFSCESAMRHLPRRAVAVALLPFLLNHGMAAAAVQMIEVNSPGNEVVVPLPPGTMEVELESQRAGNCRFGRSWGYDLSTQRMWVNGGCQGRFRLTLRDDAVAATATSNDGSNVAAGVAAMAAIAGVAILASKAHSSNHQGGYYPPPPPPPPGAGYPPPPPGYYPPQGGTNPLAGGGAAMIRNAMGGCLDEQGGRAQPGTPITLWDCRGRPNQQFWRTPRGELMVQGGCIEPQGKARNPGVQVTSWACDGSPAQRWAFTGTAIRNMQTGLCLDLPGGQMRRGTAVVTQYCNGAPSQQWFW